MKNAKVIAIYKPLAQKDMESLTTKLGNESIKSGIGYTLVILKNLFKDKFKSNKKLNAYMETLTPEFIHAVEKVKK